MTISAKGPPVGMPGTDVWDLITKIPRPFRIVDFPRNLPGTDEAVAQVRMQILTEKEQIAAAVAAERFAQTLFKVPPKRDEENLGYRNAYDNAAAIELLYRACRAADDENRSFFPTPTAMRDELSGDEIGVLMNAYLLLQSEAGPIISKLSKAEVDAWVKRLGEGASALPLAALSWVALSTLTSALALRLWTSQTDSSSLGSPSEPPTDGSSSDGDEELGDELAKRRHETPEDDLDEDDQFEPVD